MSDARSRWTDERLDDAFGRYDARLRAWEEANVDFAVLTSDVYHLREAVGGLQRALDKRDEAEEEAEERRIERGRQDLRYIIATMIAVGTLIVAALGVLGVGG